MEAIADKFIENPEEYNFRHLRDKLWDEHKDELLIKMSKIAIGEIIESIILKHTCKNYDFNWQWKDGIAQFILDHWSKFENDERVKKVLALAKQFKIEPRHVQTDHISIEPRYKDGYTRENFIGFFVRKTIVFTLRDISRFEGLLSSALDAGANYVHGVQFRTTKLREYRDQARAQAIKAAKEKAKALAKELGQRIGKPQSIHEEHSGWWHWYNSWWGSRWGGRNITQNVIQNVSGGPVETEKGIALGQISVSARVRVSFELR